MSDDEYLAAIAAVVENLAFLMPTGPAESDAGSWPVQVQVQWLGPDGSRGHIVVALDQSVADATAANLLGLPPGEKPSPQDVQEACKELANVIAGNLLPVKYGQNHEFHLHPPESVTSDAVSASAVVVRLALVEGNISVSIDGDADNSRVLKAVRVPPGLRA